MEPRLIPGEIYINLTAWQPGTTLPYPQNNFYSSNLPFQPLSSYSPTLNYLGGNSSPNPDRKEDSPPNTFTGKSINQRFASMIRNYSRTHTLPFDEITLDSDLNYSDLNNQIFIFKGKILNNHALVIFKAVCEYLEKHDLLANLLTANISLQEPREQNPSLAQFLIDHDDHPQLFDAYLEQLCKLKNPDLNHVNNLLHIILRKDNAKKNPLLNTLFVHTHKLANDHPLKKHLSSHPEIRQFFAEKSDLKNLHVEKLKGILRAGNIVQFREYCTQLRKQFDDHYESLQRPEEETFLNTVKIHYGSAFARKKICEAFCQEFQKGFNPLTEIYQSKNMSMFRNYKQSMIELFGQENLLKLKAFFAEQAKNLMLMRSIEDNTTEMGKAIKTLVLENNAAHASEKFFGGSDTERKSILCPTDPEYHPGENKKKPKAIARSRFFSSLPKPKKSLPIFMRLRTPA